MNDPILEEHQKMAASHPKLYYRDARSQWAGQAEGRALHHESAAYQERCKPGCDEALAKQHDAQARAWRVLIRN